MCPCGQPPACPCRESSSNEGSEFRSGFALMQRRACIWGLRLRAPSARPGTHERTRNGGRLAGPTVQRTLRRVGAARKPARRHRKQCALERKCHPPAHSPASLIRADRAIHAIQIETKGTTDHSASRSECHEHSVAAEISGTRILAIRVFFERPGELATADIAAATLLLQFDCATASLGEYSLVRASVQASARSSRARRLNSARPLSVSTAISTGA